MKFLTFFLFLYVVYAGDGGESTNLECSIGVGTASSTGFKWTYDLTNPDVDSQPGKVYWVLTLATETLSVEEIMAPPDSKLFDASCLGQTVQVDEEVHEVQLNCGLNVGPPATDYKFWVAVDYNGDGTLAQDATNGGHLLTPEADVDCDGIYSECGANCMKVYTVTAWPGGNGAACTTPDGQHEPCNPGEGACPLQSGFTVATPTESGFDLTTTDPSGVTGTSTWYWMVVPLGATPTAEEVRNGDGGLCGGTYGLISDDAETTTVDCSLAPGTYHVYMSEDAAGDGTVTLVSSPQDYISPPKTPEGDITVHSPNQDTTSFQLTYAVANPSTTGNLYYVVVPNGVEKPDDSDIAAGTGIAQALCYGTASQGDGSLQTTTVTCPGVTPGTTYDVYGVTDIDGAGGSLRNTNNGVAQSITFPATTTTTTTTTTTSTSQTPGQSSTSSTSTTSTTTAAPGANAAYQVKYPGQYCEPDEIGENMGMYDLITLANVRIPSSSGMTFMSDIQACANNVATNRASNLGCSTLFHTGGVSGICQCLRLGYVCDRDESENGVSIYEVVPATLQSAKPETTDNTDEFKWTYVFIFAAAFVATIGGSLFYYKTSQSRRSDMYSIPLDRASEAYSNYY